MKVWVVISKSLQNQNLFISSKKRKPLEQQLPTSITDNDSSMINTRAVAQIPTSANELVGISHRKMKTNEWRDQRRMATCRDYRILAWKNFYKREIIAKYLTLPAENDRKNRKWRHFLERTGMASFPLCEFVQIFKPTANAWKLAHEFTSIYHQKFDRRMVAERS